MKNIDFKKLMPYFAGILIFLAVTIVYFNPLIEGKVLKQSDITNFEGMSKEIKDFRTNNNGEDPLWTNSMFGGMPAYQISVNHTNNWVRYFEGYVLMGALPAPANFVFISMLGFFFLLLVLRVNPWMSIVGAIAFAFSSYFLIILEAGHNTKAIAIAYMAPVLASIIIAYRGKYLLGGALAALFLALEFNAGHPQISYYLMLVVLMLGIGELVRSVQEKALPNFVKATGVLIIAAVIAVATSASSYLTTAEYSPYTIRGASELTFDQHNQTTGLDKDYATQWSYGIAETWSLLIPNAKGGASDYLGNNKEVMAKMGTSEFTQYLTQFPAYWGDQPFTSGPVYIGALIVFFFVFGLFFVKGHYKWVLLAATVLSLMLSWGKNMMWFTDFFFDYVPAYNKFRAVSMTLVIAEFTMVILAFLSIKQILEKPETILEKKWKFYAAFGLTAGLSLLFYLMPTSFFNFLSIEEAKQLPSLIAQDPRYNDLFSEAQKARVMIFKSDAIRSFGFILVGAALIFVYAFKKIPQNILIAALGILIVADLWTVDKRYLNDDNFITETTNLAVFSPSAADQQILADKNPNFRVFNTSVNTFNDATTSYFHKSIGGYHGAKLRRYQDVITHHLTYGNMAVVNMLNTKYIIQADQNQQQVFAQLNPGALGNAWFVNKIDWVENPDQELLHLGKVIKLKNLQPNNNLQIYGRPIRDIDTILVTTDMEIKIEGQAAADDKINLSRYSIPESGSFTIGSNATDTTFGYVAITNLKNPKSIAEKQFEAEIIHVFDPAKSAIINKKFKSVLGDFTPSIDSNARIMFQSYKPNYLVYKTHCSTDQLAVFSEIYYEKGWNVYVDGKKSDYVQANYILRAMKVPAGDHTIEFKFEPKSFANGSTISLIASLILFLGVGFGLFMSFRVKKGNA